MPDFKLSVVIPAHNEEANIAGTVHELVSVLDENELQFELIVVDDNSQDQTAQVVRTLKAADARVHLVERQPPAGFGRAVRAGLEAVKGDVVVVYMADQSDDPRDVLLYYRKLSEGYDCVFGSRFVRGSYVKDYPLVKLIVNRLVNKAIQWMFWCRFNDLSNAFKGYRTYVIRECGPYRACHFNLTIEMSLGALVRGYTVAEVPIRWYGRTWGSSNLRMREMGRRYVSTLLKVFCDKVLISDDLMADRLAQHARDERVVAPIDERLQRLEARVAELEDSLAQAVEPSHRPHGQPS